MAVPQGVTSGVGIINLVNVKFTRVSGSVYLNQFYNQDSSSICTLYAKYVDMPGGYSTHVGTHVSLSYGKIHETKVFCDSSNYTYLLNLTALQSDHSNNSSTHGTSQYPSGFAPVPSVSPTGRIIRVGSTREYTTVLAAYNASQHGDDIIIDAGTYDCSAFHRASGGTLLKKCVRFWGATEDPDDVVLFNDGTCTYGCHFFAWYPYEMSNVPSTNRGPGFFHVTLQRPSGDTWEATHDIVGTAGVEDENPYVPPLANALMFSCNT